MRLPITTTPIALWLDPTLKYTKLNYGAVPVLQVASIVNRITAQTILQGTPAAQPNWSKNAIAGSYIGLNVPGASGLPGLLFNGSAQYISYDYYSAMFSGTEAPLTITVVVQCTTPATSQTLWSFGSAGAAPTLSLQYGSGNISLVESNGSTYTASAAIDSGLHVVSAIRTSTSLSLKIDGNVVAGAVISSPTTEAFTTFTLGALNNNGSISSFFGGVVGQVLGYDGAPGDIGNVEQYLLVGGSGLIRG